MSKVYCSVPQCKSLRRKNPELSFHKFPKPYTKTLQTCPITGKTLFLNCRQEWVRLFRIGKPIAPFMVACSKHFKEFDYIANKKKVQRRRLKRYAIPSLYLPVTPNAETIPTNSAYNSSLHRRTLPKVAKEIKFDPTNASVKDPRSSTLQLFNKNEAGKNAVKSLEDNKFKFDPTNASVTDPRSSTLQLFNKNEAVKNAVKSLEDNKFKFDPTNASVMDPRSSTLQLFNKNEAVKNAVKSLDDNNASVEDLKSSTLQLFNKNEAVKNSIKSLEDNGYREDQLDWYKDKLQELISTTDLARRIMENIAFLKNTTLAKVEVELNITK